MENTYHKNNVTFPIIPDGAVLVADNRVIMTNQQLIIKNPDAATERFEYNFDEKTVTNQTSQAYGPIQNQTSPIEPRMPQSRQEQATATVQPKTKSRYEPSSDVFERLRQMPTTAGKRPLSANSRTLLVDKPKRQSPIDDAKKRARENAIPPKPIKPYKHPLDTADTDELGINSLANKKVMKTQHSLGKSASSYLQAVAQQQVQPQVNKSPFDTPQQDYFTSKRSNRSTFDAVESQ
ncbi:hypothetical protein Hs30E_00090 [Lactococcus hodotermopsidis]|uniref:Uncharacterized protein n=1 Tax=Pseudolactococcus hodotermopsidis TaxID=2709157 RepID=A0A6A0BAH5_9LACT|nr:hypothetical protein [Lactococcus hodotermopsidis]GFH41458.1 hypothetical protein Hs30E_00090 [Lactococcus hodotermopsidis]